MLPKISITSSQRDTITSNVWFNDHLSLACALALEKATGGWVAPWHSWLADLPNSVMVQQATPAKKSSPRRRQKTGAE